MLPPGQLRNIFSIYTRIFFRLGHYSVPRIPELPGLENFGGMIMHSHDYRTPEPFKNKTVVVLGAAASGSDIAIEICDLARKVYLCHNTPTLPSKFSGKLFPLWKQIF